MPLDDPALVVGLPEREQRQTQLLDGVEAADPQQILLQHAHKSFGAAIPLRLAHEGRRALDAQKGQLLLEIVADVLAAVIVAELETASDVLAEAAETRAHRLPDRLERLETIGAAAGMDADAPGGAVVNGDEHRGLALAGHDAGQVGTPHEIDPFGGDRAVVGARAMRPAGTLVGQEAVLAHQPQDAAPAGADARKPQPRPQLAIALAVERAVGQQLADRRVQGLVRHRAARPWRPAHARCGAAVAVDGGPRHAPDPGDPLPAVDPPGGGRDLPAHRLDTKGRAVSRRSILAASSSLA